MIRHQHVRRQNPGEPRDADTEQTQEEFAVAIVEKDVLLSVAATGDVVERAGIFDSKWSRHSGTEATSEQH